MVTAIVIPIICLYFFWLTRKEMREQDVKWRSIGQVPKEAIVTGEIKSTYDEKQKFYYNRFVYVQTCKLQTETKQITIKKLTPITKDILIVPFQIGEKIQAFGTYRDQIFYCSSIEKGD